MRHLLLAAFAAVLATSSALAHTPHRHAVVSSGKHRVAAPPGEHRVAASPGEQCQIAIDAAEHAQALPPHLLAAIGQVESGRRDPGTRQWTPWPWTIDVGGQGTFFPTKEDAIAAVRVLQAQGVRSIDVGCVQINLAQHPDAFRSLEDAFDPEINTRYGAAFLARLFTMTRDWNKAAALYHSATPALGAAYEQKVLAALSGRYGGALIAKPSAPLILLPTPEQQLAAAWAATLDKGSDSSENIVAFTNLVAPSPSGAKPSRSLSRSRLNPNATWMTASRDALQ